MVSIADEIKDDKKGGTNHSLLFLSLLKIFASSSWAIKNAVPEPITIRIEIKLKSLIEKNRETKTPHTKPAWMTLFVN